MKETIEVTKIKAGTQIEDSRMTGTILVIDDDKIPIEDLKAWVKCVLLPRCEKDVECWLRFQ